MEVPVEGFLDVAHILHLRNPPNWDLLSSFFVNLFRTHFITWWSEVISNLEDWTGSVSCCYLGLLEWVEWRSREERVTLTKLGVFEQTEWHWLVAGFKTSLEIQHTGRGWPLLTIRNNATWHHTHSHATPGRRKGWLVGGICSSRLGQRVFCFFNQASSGSSTI